MLSHLLLYRELNERASRRDAIATELKARLDLATPQLTRVLSDIRRYFAHFTDHSITHSVRIVSNIEMLLSTQSHASSAVAPLTSVDLFLLIAGALIHDIGMAVGDGELDALTSESRFKAHLAAWKTPQDTAPDWYRRGIPRLAVADYVRKYHAQRSLKIVLDRDIVPEALTSGAPRLAYWLGTIAAGHGMNFDAISDINVFPVRELVQLANGLQEFCNPRFAALCLRLGDLLDIGTARACPMLRNLSEPLSLLSKSHWDQYADVGVRFDPQRRDIAVAGTCPTQDAERVLREWFTWLKEESIRATALQNLEEDRYRLHVGQIDYKVTPRVGADGRPSYEFLELRFNLDEKMVFERLFGRSLYGRPELAFRELIQNAVDAQRARILHDLSSAPDWMTVDDQTRRFRFQESLSSRRNNLPIQIVVEERPIEGTTDRARWISINDQGIGMTRDTLERYFLKVGRSRWAEDPTIGRLGIGSFTIGTFGIGVLSTLMVADRIVVETRSCLPDERGVRATIYGWQGYLATERYESSTPGTRVSLRLLAPETATTESLVCIVAEFAPRADFPLVIVSGGVRLAVPQLSFDVSTKANTSDGKNRVSLQAIAHLDAEGSMVSILSETRDRKTTWVGDPNSVALVQQRNRKIVACQDGLAIGEVPAPQGVDPESKVLAQYQVLLDLRGSSRVALDLSRNLPEGGHERFWQIFVPRAWDALASTFPDDETARRSLAYLAEAEIVSASLDPLRFVKSRGGLLRGLASVTQETEIRCVDALAEGRAKDIVAEGGAIWLVPPVDLHRASDLSHHVLSLVMAEELSYFYRSKLGHKRARYSACLDTECRRLLQVFGYLDQGGASSCILTKTPTSKGRPVSELLGFRITDQWLCLRHPTTCEFGLVPIPHRDVVGESARAAGLGLADYYLCLMQMVFEPKLEHWGGRDHSWSELFAQVQEHLNVDAEDDDDQEPTVTPSRRDEEREIGEAAAEAELEEGRQNARNVTPSYLLFDDRDGEDDDEEVDEDDDDGEDDEYDGPPSRSDELEEMERDFREHTRKQTHRFAGVAQACGLSEAVASWEESAWNRG